MHYVEFVLLFIFKHGDVKLFNNGDSTFTVKATFMDFKKKSDASETDFENVMNNMSSMLEKLFLS